MVQIIHLNLDTHFIICLSIICYLSAYLPIIYYLAIYLPFYLSDLLQIDCSSEHVRRAGQWEAETDVMPDSPQISSTKIFSYLLNQVKNNIAKSCSKLFLSANNIVCKILYVGSCRPYSFFLYPCIVLYRMYVIWFIQPLSYIN